MKNSFGNNIVLTLFGESHGPSVGAVLDGLPAGIPVDTEEIARLLTLRRPAGAISTARAERDPFVIESGIFNGHTCGTPICIRIPNTDTRSKDYQTRVVRPAHADLAAHYKYHGFEDWRGGGHFSGRITAAVVAAGAILLQALARKEIYIGTHIARIGTVCDRPFEDFTKDIQALGQKNFAVLDEERGAEMQELILSVKAAGDSIGGVLESVVVGLPAGVGEPFFDGLESTLSHALFSIPAVKGVEFGDGFVLAGLRGSQANDPIRNDGKVELLSHHAGGLFGGISVGAPLLMRTAIKPTPTIALEQQTVSLPELKNTTLAAKGRHDPCIVHRARVVADCMIALTLADALTARFGSEWLV